MKIISVSICSLFGICLTGYGIFNLDQDKERFTTLIEQYRIANNGALPLDLEGFVVISDE